MPETLATRPASILKQDKQESFLIALRGQEEWSPADAREKTGLTAFETETWIQRDPVFREQYDLIKKTWTGKVTEKAVKTIAMRMFDKGKEWLLVQWLKVHDEDWRQANRAIVNSFTQVSLVSSVRGGLKPISIENQGIGRENPTMSPDEQGRMRLETMREAREAK